MAKFYGAIGYAISEEITPGVWKEQFKECYYSGDLIRNTRRLQSTSNLNDDINIGNDISIIADPFAYENFHSMRYVNFMGVNWTITNVEVQYPRLLLSIGGLYNV